MAVLIWKIKDIVEVIEGCVNNDYDVILFIEGSRGSGKSTLGYKIAKRLDNRGLVHFNPESNQVYSREDTIRILATKKKNVILSDELINVAYNRDFYEQDQKVLLKALNMYRDSLNVFIGCIPKFNNLDTQIKVLCKLRISIIERGLALVQVPLRGVFVPDPWDTQENIKRELKNRKGYGKLSTVKGLLRFTDLKPEQKVKYKKLKELKRGQVFESNLTQDIRDPDKRFFDNVYNMVTKGYLTNEGLESICLVNNKNISSFRERINKKLRDDKDRQGSLKMYLELAEKRKKNGLESTNIDTSSQNTPTFNAPKIYKIK